jgi:hypothetical protein
MSDIQVAQEESPLCPHCRTRTKLAAVLFRTHTGALKPVRLFGCSKCAKLVLQQEVRFGRDGRVQRWT